MLDPWIIEEILRRENDRRREQERPRIEVPLESPRRDRDPAEANPPPRGEERGVVVIDI